MKKNVVWMLFILTIVASLLVTACGAPAAEEPMEEPAAEEPMAEEPAAEEPAEEAVVEEPAADLVELIVWADDTRSPVINDLAASVAEEYGVSLVVQEMAFGDIRDQLAVAGPAGEGPDIIIGAHDWLGQLVANGLVAPLDMGAKEADFLPAAVTAFSYEGTLYGLPYGTENVAFLCNPDLVETTPATWDDVTALAETLEAESDGAVTAWTIQTRDPYHYFPLMTAYGGYVFGLTDAGYDPADVGLDSEGAIAAATWMSDMAAAGHLEPDVDYDVMHALFNNSEVACIGTGPWALPMIRESGVNYVVSAYPEGPAGVAKPFMGVQGFMVSAFSENQLLAQTVLLEIFATEDFMQALFDADPRPSAYMSVRDAISDPDIAAFAAAGQEAYPMPAIPEMSSVWEAWTNAEELVITQQLTPEEAFSDAAEQVRTLIAE
ncbi:MAG: maltose ABC transporter substrate-binding protein [Anaerolineales bacterium]|nr:maltose ABC transporter substrate-binding protein [Anaerolineales bacterium]